MSPLTTTGLADLAELVGLLERSADHLLEALPAITEADLDRATPCSGWDLRTLLMHVADSVDALERLHQTGTMEGASTSRTGADPVGLARDRVPQLVADLRAASTGATPLDDERIGWAIAAAQAATVEFAGHGVDVEATLTTHRPIPDAHAEDLLTLCRALLPDESRPPVFGPRVQLPPGATGSDRFAAYLGRDTRP